MRNLLGFPGAIFADLAMQLLGLASVLLLLPEALLGWRLLSHRPLGEKWRGLVWIVATLVRRRFRLDAAAHRLLAASYRIGRRYRRCAAAAAGDAAARSALRPEPARRRGAAGHSTAAALLFAGRLHMVAGARITTKTTKTSRTMRTRPRLRLARLHRACAAELEGALGRMLRRKPRQPLAATRPMPDGRFEPRFDGMIRAPLAPEQDFVEDRRR